MSDTVPLVEKTCIPIGDTDPKDSRAINEVARDSWPKMVTSQTHFHGFDDDKVIYRGPVDTRLYDDSDIEMMYNSDTVTVVEEVEDPITNTGGKEA